MVRMFVSIRGMELAVLAFAGVMAFHVVTLPVEINASTRAYGILTRFGLLSSREADGARWVLRAGRTSSTPCPRARPGRRKPPRSRHPWRARRDRRATRTEAGSKPGPCVLLPLSPSVPPSGLLHRRCRVFLRRASDADSAVYAVGNGVLCGFDRRTFVLATV
jgi:hypothetical protein